MTPELEIAINALSVWIADLLVHPSVDPVRNHELYMLINERIKTWPFITKVNI